MNSKSSDTSEPVFDIVGGQLGVTGRQQKRWLDSKKISFQYLQRTRISLAMALVASARAPQSFTPCLHPHPGLVYLIERPKLGAYMFPHTEEFLHFYANSPQGRLSYGRRGKLP